MRADANTIVIGYGVEKVHGHLLVGIAGSQPRGVDRGGNLWESNMHTHAHNNPYRSVRIESGYWPCNSSACGRKSQDSVDEKPVRDKHTRCCVPCLLADFVELFMRPDGQCVHDAGKVWSSGCHDHIPATHEGKSVLAIQIKPFAATLTDG
jgi:hypothetical protein